MLALRTTVNLPADPEHGIAQNAKIDFVFSPEPSVVKQEIEEAQTEGFQDDFIVPIFAVQSRVDVDSDTEDPDLINIKITCLEQALQTPQGVRRIVPPHAFAHGCLMATIALARGVGKSDLAENEDCLFIGFIMSEMFGGVSQWYMMQSMMQVQPLQPENKIILPGH